MLSKKQINYLQSLTDQQFFRLERRVHAIVYAISPSKTFFLVDNQTLAIINPSWHKVYQAMSSEFCRRFLL